MADQPPGTLELIAKELALAFQPIEEKFASGKIRATLASLGLRLPENLETFADFITTITDLITQAGKIPTLVTEVENAVQNEDLGAAITAVKDVSQFLKDIITDATNIGTELKSISGSLAGVDAGELTTFAEELPIRIFEYLIVYHLEGYFPVLLNILNIAGLVTYEEVPGVDGNVSNPAYLKRSITLDNFGNFFNDPGNYFKLLYGWGDPTYDGKKLFSNINKLISTVGLPVIYHWPKLPADIPSFEFSFLTLQPYLTGPKKGLELILQGDLSKGLEIKLPFIKDNWFFDMVINADIKASTSLILDSGGNFTLVPPSGQADGDLSFNFVMDPPAGQPSMLILGETGGSRITVNEFKTGIKTSFDWNSGTNQAEGSFAWETALSQCKVIVDTSNSDGFIGAILGKTKIEGDFDLLIGVSSSKGLYFQGSSALEIQLPTHIDLGPVSIEGLNLTIKFDSGTIPVSVGANIKGDLGPLVVVVDNIGVTGTFSFPPNNSGNLGPLQLDLGFKPPDGVGLSIDTGIIKGGGYLYINTDKGEYFGALELEFEDLFSLKAVGIVNTRMPDGSPGFSLLIIITADFVPIQLGFGFTLNGVGGLLGLNRTMSVDALKEGVKTGAVNSVLFPQDIIANIDKIVSDLEAIFPVYQGHFIVGPMGELGWASIITLEIGILIEIPDPKIAILGILKAIIPTEDVPILKIQVNFVGIIDFDNQIILFNASLYDSTLLIFTLTGDMAFRLCWGDHPYFLLSVGGFNPAFKDAPADLQNMVRLGISLLNNDYLKLSVTCYFAVTSNSVQFGANAQLYAGVGALNIQGWLGFDVLFQFDPFSFAFGINIGLTLCSGSTVIMGITVSGNLTGPTPWDIQGEATYTLIFVPISVSFQKTWGDSATDQSQNKIDIIQLLTDAIANNGNWQAVIPDNNSQHVSIKSITPGTTDPVVHPFGTLTFSERIAPLGIDITRFGNDLPKDANHFDIVA